MPNRRRTTGWILYLATLLSAVPLAAIIAFANPQPEGACSGIGWGCSLYGWDAAGFTLLLLGVPYALVLAAILGVLSLLPDRWANGVTVVGGIGLAIPWGFAAVALISSA